MALAFNNAREIGEAYDAGQVIWSQWRKAPAVVTAAGYWLDLSMTPGNPRPNYYASAPLEAAQLARSTDGGIDHGPPMGSSNAKWLRKLSARTVTAGAVPLHLLLCDYLLYYPFVDESLLDEQPTTQPVALSRYSDGAGVQLMAVCVGPQAGGATFTVRYTNSEGVSDRVTVAATMGTQAVNGTVLTSAPATAGSKGPFLTLQAGDSGVRSVEGITIGGAGDVGLMTIVLVKPLVNLALRETTAAVEVDFLTDTSRMVRVYDDAYLNFVARTMGSVTGASIFGDAEFIWS